MKKIGLRQIHLSGKVEILESEWDHIQKIEKLNSNNLELKSKNQSLADKENELLSLIKNRKENLLQITG